MKRPGRRRRQLGEATLQANAQVKAEVMRRMYCKREEREDVVKEGGVRKEPLYDDDIVWESAEEEDEEEDEEEEDDEEEEETEHQLAIRRTCPCVEYLDRLDLGAPDCLLCLGEHYVTKWVAADQDENGNYVAPHAEVAEAFKVLKAYRTLLEAGYTLEPLPPAPFNDTDPDNER